MNDIVNKFLMDGDWFIPESYLRQPEFTHSGCGPFTKHCGRIQKLRETCDLKHFYKYDLDKACFSHDATYSDSKDLAKKTISDMISEDRA